MLGVAALGAYRAWRGAGFVTLFPPLALALVLAFIVFNKVGLAAVHDLDHRARSSSGS